MDDRRILDEITQLVEEERELYGKDRLEESDRRRLDKLQVQLDQCWDLLRQRRALRETGADPDRARLRDPQTVETYEQ